MKQLFIIGLVLHCTFVWAGGPANQQTIVLSEFHLDDVRKLTEMQPQVTHLILEGPGQYEDVKRIFQCFEGNTSLFSIELRNVHVGVLPNAIKKIPQLTMLRISGFGSFDPVPTLEVIDQLSSLRSLELDIISLNDLPQELFQLQQIDRLVLHEYLPDGATAATECIAVQMDLFENERTIKSIQAFVYVSQTTWDRLQNADAIGSMRIVRECQPVVHRYDHVNPPIASQDVDFVTTTVAAQAGGAMTDPISNSVVRIPADAFVDASGNKITGEVVVSYRVFMDPADFIVSGIPMSFTENGQTSYFESAGMVEVNAAANGKEVFLAEGKTIDVLLQSTDDTRTFDVWNFDDSTGTWLDVGQSQPASPDEVENFVKPSQAEFFLLHNADDWGKSVDSTSFENRFLSPWYVNSVSARSKDWTPLSDEGKTLRRNARKFNHWIRIRSVQEDVDGQLYFRLQGNRFLHPELRYLRSSYFRVDQTTSKRLFRKEWAGNYRYSDMRVVERDGQTVLVLKDHNGLREVEVTSVARSKKDGAWAYEKAIWPQRSYNKSLNRRRVRFDAAVMRKFKRNAKRKEISEMRLRRQTEKLMTDEERAMSWETFMANARAKVNAFNLQRARLNKMSSQVARILEVNQLGLCNIDRMERLPVTEFIAVEFLIDSVPVHIDRIYICLNNANSAVTNDVNPSRVIQSVMYCGPATSSVLFITSDLRMGLISGEQMQNAYASRKGIVQLQATELPPNVDLKSVKL